MYGKGVCVVIEILLRESLIKPALKKNDRQCSVYSPFCGTSVLPRRQWNTYRDILSPPGTMGIG